MKARRMWRVMRQQNSESLLWFRKFAIEKMRGFVLRKVKMMAICDGADMINLLRDFNPMV